MTEQFQTLVRQELSSDPAPPRDVVTAALRAGRRGRRRRWAAATGAVALLAAAIVALPSVVPWQAWRLSSQAGAAVRVVPASGPMVPATPAGALEALRYLLPTGRLGPYTGQWDFENMFVVRAEYTTDRGTITVALNIMSNDNAVMGTEECPHTLFFTTSCVTTTLADHRVVTVMHVDGNCDEATVVRVTRPDRTEVVLFLSSCVRSSVPAPVLLTDGEAVAIAVNPVFGLRMPASVVDAGARDFPDLPGGPR